VSSNWLLAFFSSLDLSIMRPKALIVILLALICSSVFGFVMNSKTRLAFAGLEATKKNHLVEAAAAAVIAVATSPLVAVAADQDDYEYGAVNAPIGLAWGVGVIAILTALLPLALRSGEEAFGEMKDRDADKWGKK
jgi:hypothetical protein